MMSKLSTPVVCVTGASSGIGAACAQLFAQNGASLLLCARRVDRVEALAGRLRTEYGVPAHTFRLDVTDPSAVEKNFSALPDRWRKIDILLNNAGQARGFSRMHDGSLQDWEEMIDTNVKGLLYVTRVVLPGMVKRRRGHIINIGSIAGHQVYPNGNVYCATKFAVRALTQGLKMDLLGTGVRVCSVSPGLVQTEFSEVRFHGDRERADQTYKDMRPLTAQDIADVVFFCATRPPHVDISEVVVMPTDQASAYHVHRSS